MTDWKEGNPAGTSLTGLYVDTTLFVFIKDTGGQVVSKEIGIISSILSIPLMQGESIRLAASYDFNDNAQFIWSSSDHQVAVVDQNGNVTGGERGIAYITVKNASSTLNKSIPVRVMDSMPDPDPDPDPGEQMPTVTEVQITADGARIIGTDDVAVVQYGISGTSDSSTATWKKSNVFANVKPGLTYYAFVKDADGNVSEPFEFTMPTQ